LSLTASVGPFLRVKFFLELFVFPKQFLVEALLHLKITPHILNLSVPEVYCPSLTLSKAGKPSQKIAAA
jgi:hypothetical protein